MQITLPFFAFVSLNVMSYSHVTGKENIEISSEYTTDHNEASQISVIDDKEQMVDNGNER